MTASTSGIRYARVAEQLKGELAEERADASGEVRRLESEPVLKNQTGIRRVVARERNQPEQGEREQRDAHELAQAAGNGGSCQVRSP